MIYCPPHLQRESSSENTCSEVLSSSKDIINRQFHNVDLRIKPLHWVAKDGWLLKLTYCHLPEMQGLPELDRRKLQPYSLSPD